MLCCEDFGCEPDADPDWMFKFIDEYRIADDRASELMARLADPEALRAELEAVAAFNMSTQPDAIQALCDWYEVSSLAPSDHPSRRLGSGAARDDDDE